MSSGTNTGITTKNPLKIALIGYGKMGRQVEWIARQRGHTLVARISPSQAATPRCSPELLSTCDICIDFSQPEAVEHHVLCAAQAGKNIVIGTTGWQDKLPTIQQMVHTYQIGLLFSPNFSIGMHLFHKLVAEAVRQLHSAGYEMAGCEWHHSQKKDIPSGTALSLATLACPPIPFSSVRVGHIPGTHSIIFDSEHDNITLTHQAKGRSGFALGSIHAAEWLMNKKGYFTLEDISEDTSDLFPFFR